MADPELARRVIAAGYRIPIRRRWADGKRYVSYALPREFDGLLHEGRVKRRGRGGPFFHSPQYRGVADRFSVDDETGGTLLWVNIYGGPEHMPPAEDTMVIHLADVPDYTVYPYRVVWVLREGAESPDA